MGVRMLRPNRLAVRSLEGAAAAAGGDGLRIVNLEPGAHRRFNVVDAGALEIRAALRVDIDLQPAKVVDEVLIAGRIVQRHAIAEAGAPPTGDVDPQPRALPVLRGDELLY